MLKKQSLNWMAQHEGCLRVRLSLAPQCLCCEDVCVMGHWTQVTGCLLSAGQPPQPPPASSRQKLHTHISILSLELVKNKQNILDTFQLCRFRNLHNPCKWTNLKKIKTEIFSYKTGFSFYLLLKSLLEIYMLCIEFLLCIYTSLMYSSSPYQIWSD